MLEKLKQNKTTVIWFILVFLFSIAAISYNRIVLLEGRVDNHETKIIEINKSIQELSWEVWNLSQSRNEKELDIQLLNTKKAEFEKQIIELKSEQKRLSETANYNRKLIQQLSDYNDWTYEKDPISFQK